MKTQKFIVIRLHFPPQNLSCLGLGSNKGFASTACSYDFKRFVLGFFFSFSLIPNENKTGVILTLAAVVVEKHMQHT